MSDLTFIEKRKLEQTFGMSSGYVLDFSNKTFAEFFIDYMGIDIYNPRYDNGSNSKANRMRAFWLKEDNATVGKLINHLIDYSERDGALEAASRLIAHRLLSGTAASHMVTGSPANAFSGNATSVQPALSKELANLREEFSRLAVETDRNKAGLALEKLLNHLFEISQLKPRLPFRVVGEQIDGSFELDGEIYLLESKWEKDPLPEGPLLVFRGKIEGKSQFTRGMFIALNDISLPARDAITRGKSPSFFVVNGHDLMMILSEAITLTDFLRKRFRLLAEEGCVCVPFPELM